MKKLFLGAIIALTLASCQIDGGPLLTSKDTPSVETIVIDSLNTTESQIAE